MRDRHDIDEDAWDQEHRITLEVLLDIRDLLESISNKMEQQK